MSTELMAELLTVADCDKAIESVGESPMLASIKVLIQSKREMLVKEQEQEQIKQDFAKALHTIELPIPPEGITNVYCSFGQLTRALTAKERKEVATSLPNLTEEELNARRVECGIGWRLWEVNKAITVTHGTGTKASVAKRAITVLKIVHGNVEVVGNFRNGAEACKHLGLGFEGNSAPRVLRDAAYILQFYEGTEYTLPG